MTNRPLSERGAIDESASDFAALLTTSVEASFEDVLATCLEAVEAGQTTPAEAATRHPQHPELLELLELAQAIAAVPMPVMGLNGNGANGRVDHAPDARPMALAIDDPQEPGEPHFELALATCLKEVEAGRATPAEAAERYPQYPEMLDLLELAGAIQAVPLPRADARMRRFGDNVMIFATPRPVHLERVEGPKRVKTPALAAESALSLPRGRILAFSRSRSWRPRVLSWPAQPALRAAAVLMPLMLAWSAIAPAAQAAMPGDPLYPMKRLKEQVELVVTLDESARADTRLAHIAERIKEAGKATLDARTRESLLAHAALDADVLRKQAVRLPEPVAQRVAVIAEQLEQQAAVLEATQPGRSSQQSPRPRSNESGPRLAAGAATVLAQPAVPAQPTVPIAIPRPAETGRERQQPPASAARLQDLKSGAETAKKDEQKDDSPRPSAQRRTEEKPRASAETPKAKTAAASQAVAEAAAGGGGSTASAQPTTTPTAAPSAEPTRAIATAKQPDSRQSALSSSSSGSRASSSTPTPTVSRQRRAAEHPSADSDAEAEATDPSPPGSGPTSQTNDANVKPDDKKDDPPQSDDQKTASPKAEQKPVEQPKTEEKKTETPKDEQKDAPKSDDHKVDLTKDDNKNSSKTDDKKTDAPKTDEKKSELPKVGDATDEKPKTEDKPAVVKTDPPKTEDKKSAPPKDDKKDPPKTDDKKAEPPKDQKQDSPTFEQKKTEPSNDQKQDLPKTEDKKTEPPKDDKEASSSQVDEKKDDKPKTLEVKATPAPTVTKDTKDKTDKR